MGLKVVNLKTEDRDMDKTWKTFKGQVKDQTFSEIEEAAASIEHNTSRVRLARAALRAGDLRGEELEEMKEELSFAISDLEFAKTWLGKAICQANREQLEALGSSEEKDWRKEEEKRHQELPHEKARKAQIETALGKEISWSEYWKYLDGLYEEQTRLSEERYSETVRGYGWDFDAGRADALFPSDLGKVRPMSQVQLLARDKTQGS